ncbi:ferritin family protein [Desulfotomaculum copahuensis]|uniref:Rubrerythrin diiron-binding domain-containing protein n=1 Tax=Desulfotomaculum copahuensis TaxID=1838280 RepID=A0A1B7LF63_9FIRM|nr:ferritin family protein [Desulfotomaculum copahuensis]OAT82268.1 hypothetical protein A6M21_08900 [Desulfotomaculum copahuensis]
MPENELNLLKTAILNEMEGHQFYTLAAQQVKDTDTKQALLFLAEEEEKHKSWLLNLYRNIARNQPPDPSAFRDIPSPGIFEPGKVKPESGSLEVSVFRIGILMEKASVDFYRRAAAESRRDDVKKLCARLAEWETGHLDMLEKTYDYLKEEWWEKQGFSPA